MEKLKLYVRTPLNGNEFKVCNELTDEVVAIFFNQQDAVNYATTPILPSELLKQNKELLAALFELRNAVFSENDIRLLAASQSAKDLINKINATNA
jgi:hypothetical protein